MRYSDPEAGSSIAGNDKEPGSPPDAHKDAARWYVSNFTTVLVRIRYITD
jgi:hypothetical protein